MYEEYDSIEACLEHKFVSSNGFYVCIHCGLCLDQKVFSNSSYLPDLKTLARKNQFEFRTARYMKADYKNRYWMATFRPILKEMGFSGHFIEHIFNQWLKLRKQSCRTHPKAILVFAYVNAINEAQKQSIIEYYNRTYDYKSKYQFFVYKHKVMKAYRRCM